MKAKNVLFTLFFSLISYTKPLYFCTASNDHYFSHLINLIGSIHRTNFDNLIEVAVFDLGLTQNQIIQLKKIDKVRYLSLEKKHSNLLNFFNTPPSSIYPHGRKILGWYAWKPVCIKQALDLYPYVLWLDAGSTVLKPLDHLFEYIEKTGHLLCTIGDSKTNNMYDHPIRWGTTNFVSQAFKLNSKEWSWILDQEFIMANMIGVARSNIDQIINPLYELTDDLRYYQEDGSTPNGWGCGRHDQTLLSILTYQKNLIFHQQDYTQKKPIKLDQDFFITWNSNYVDHKTHIYSSRSDIYNKKVNTEALKYKTPNHLKGFYNE